MKLFLVFAVLLSLPIFASDDDVKAAEEIIKKRDAGIDSRQGARVASAIATFGLAQHARLALAQRAGNVVTSPLSVFNNLSLALNGTGGETMKQLTAGLKLGLLDRQSVNNGLVDLNASIQTRSLSLVNALFVDDRFDLRPDFTRSLSALGADVLRKDFSGAEAIPFINEYISEHTGGRIQKAVSQLPLKASFLNAGYFKDGWAVPFFAASTFPDDFRGNGPNITVPMMSASGTYLYHREDDLFSMVTLAYHGSEFAFDLIVPDLKTGELSEAALERVEKRMVADDGYRQWIKMEENVRVRLKLPRFRTQYGRDIAPDLAGEMPLVFSEKADFSPMTADKFSLPGLFHIVVLEVDENGTEGAFATFGGPRSLPRKIEADHSFIAIVRHVPSGVPVFIATVRAPGTI